MADPANHIFLPWVQPGVAANIPDQATEQLTANQPSRVTLPVSLAINNVPVPQTVRLYGPANVKGIDPQQVVRTEPRAGTNNFEPNYFPAIEFDRPDFPWLFTPAKADAQGRLRPWLCLIVVRKQTGVELSPSNGQSLPVLTIKKPAKPSDELPDLSESWVWAHAQMTGTDKNQIKATMASDPARSVSRLLCPRRLDPNTEYLACLVPAFEVGRKAGLGLDIDPREEQFLEPAWKSGTQSRDEDVLPVYYSWDFRTAPDGDFEDLVRLLEPREISADVGKRPLDINHPGFAIQPQPPAMILGLEGALRVVKSESDPWPDETRLPFQTALATILNTPWEILTDVASDKDPIVAPPIYGCWQAAVHKVVVPPSPPPPSPPFWLDELNLDPRTRVAAGMGTRVIQDQQEQLMASAWQQLGDIEKINQRMRQAQLSRAVNDKYHSRVFNRFSDETFLKIIAPVESRLEIVSQSATQPAAKSLLVQELSRSLAPVAVSPSLRKMARPRGVINRQLSQAGGTGVGAMFSLLRPGPAGFLPGAPSSSRGAVTIDQVSEIVANGVQRRTVRDHRGPTVVITEMLVLFNPDPAPGRFERVADDFLQVLATFHLNNLTGSGLASRQTTAPTSPQFFEAARAHQEFLSNAFIQMIFAFPIALNLQQSISTIKSAALASLDPARTVAIAVMASVQINSPKAQTGDDLEPIMDAPTFPQPMYEALRDLSQDFIFPGLDKVPPNTVQLLQTNAKFIESFMVGLNAEMGRELLWRGYPTDQRGTYFQQFWDTRTSAVQPHLDIPPINQWEKRELGTTAVGAGGDKLVLLIRGELLRRYPNTVIYAVRAVESDGARDLSTKPDDERHPLFRGTLQPDVTFVGFDLTADEVVTDPGWFFVLQQQPTEPRFGLDEAPYLEGKTEVPELATWNDLNWAHLAPDEAALQKLGFVSVGKFNLVPSSQVTGIWGRNSAHMAYITRQLPVRVAIHAKELLRPQS